MRGTHRTHLFFCQIWDLSVSPNGKYIATAGHDKTLRLWERTQEPLVLEDERETERENEEEEAVGQGDSRVIPGGEKDAEAVLPTKKTADTERAAERLMEALVAYQEYMAQLKEVIAQRKLTGKEYADPQASHAHKAQ